MASEHHIGQALDILTAPRAAAPRAAASLGARSRSAASPRDEHPWMNDQGICAMGIAERVTEGTILEEVVLKVYVEKKLRLDKVQHRIPAELQFDGLPPIPTDVEESGRISLHSNTMRVRPAPPGYSVGLVGDKSGTGTFGLVVRKRGQKSPLYLLSNSHAIANSGMATKGEGIIQPGAYDGGVPATDGIGQLAEWIPFIFSEEDYPNLVDAAIAALDADQATAAISQLGVPTGVNTTVTRGMEVQKVGRTTTLSIALVKDVNLRIASNYPTAGGKIGRVGFSDQIMTSFYSAPGDSGSGVLDKQGQVVGLHFAGSAIVGVCNKIENVLTALGLEVVTAADVSGTTQGGN